MSILKRGIVFVVGTISCAVLFLFHSRVVLTILDIATEVAGTGPATSALNMLPIAIQLAIGGLQVGFTLYFIGGLAQERTSVQRPMQ